MDALVSRIGTVDVTPNTITQARVPSHTHTWLGRTEVVEVIWDVYCMCLDVGRT